MYLIGFSKNLASSGKLLLSSPKSAYCWCSTIGTPHRRAAGRTIPVGDFVRFTHSHGYASAGDHPNCFTSFSLNSDPFMQYAG